MAANPLLFLIGLVVSLLILLTSAEIIDDFTKPPEDRTNNIGFMRGNDGDQGADLDTHGILLTDPNDRWVEMLAKPDECADLTDKALVIHYLSKWRTVFSIQLRQKGMNCQGNHSITISTHVAIDPSCDTISVPMHAFAGAILSHCYAVAIQSYTSAVISKLELVDRGIERTDFFTKLDQFNGIIPSKDEVYTQTVQVSKVNSMKQVYHRIRDMEPDTLFKPWKDIITGEVKQVGYRDFFTFSSRELFMPSLSNYFEYTRNGCTDIQMIPYPSSLFINRSVFSHYRFVGRFVGMAIYHKQHLDVSLSIAIYKSILQKPITLVDVYSIDPSMFTYLQYILDHDIDTLRLTMSTTIKFKGEKARIHDLKKYGRQILVTNENKQEYVDLMIDWKYCTSIRKQANSFRKGILEIVPSAALHIFDAHELKLLVEGRTDIDVDDWQEHTKYNTRYSTDDLVIQWFWQYVRSLSGIQQGKLLEFVTGSPRLAVTGFMDLVGHPFYITRSHVNTNDEENMLLPQGLMNLNILILPQYSSYEVLAEQLNKSIDF